MLSFNISLHKILILFILTYLSPFVITEATKVQCTLGYNPNGDEGNAVCWDSNDKIWKCPRKECSYNYRQFTPMKGCLHDGWPGTSLQECSGYQIQNSHVYECWNTGGQHYRCPTPPDSPFITCSDCVPPS